MTTRVIWVKKDATFREMAVALREHRVSAFPVVDDDHKVIGVVSEADMLAKEALEDEPGVTLGLLTGNVVRAAPIGVGVSVVPGAGSAVVANNSISDARRAAVAGMDHLNMITGDLAREGAARHAQIAINGNQVN